MTPTHRGRAASRATLISMKDFSQTIVSNHEISSCSDTGLADMSNICFNVRPFVFVME